MTEICDPTWPNPTQSMDGPDPRPSLQPGHKPPTLYLYLKCIGRWTFNFNNPRWRTAYTIARYMLSLCVRLSVGPSVCHKPVLYRNESSWFLAKRLLSTYPILCYKEIRIYQKLRYFPLGLFIPNSGLWKFRHGKSIAFLTALVVVVVVGRACWRHLYDDRRVVAVYYKSTNCNPRDSVTAICCGFVVQLVSTVDKNLTDSASPGPSEVAELLASGGGGEPTCQMHHQDERIRV